MELKTYLKVVKFNFARIWAYPTEIFAFICKRLFALGFLILFWTAVQKSSGGIFNFKHLVAYFLVISALNDLVFVTHFSFGERIYRLVKSGEISNFLIKPINMIPYLLFTHVGGAFVLLVYSVVVLIAGMFVLPFASPINLIGFLILAFISFFISLSINILLSVMTFYIVEARSLMHVATHINSILSGTMIPLMFFPGMIKKIILLTPFAAASYSPVFVLQNKVSYFEFAKIAGVSLFWAVLLLILSFYLWKRR